MDSAAGLPACPRAVSLPSGGAGSFLPKMSSQLPIGVAAVRRAVFFFRCHLGKGFLGSARLKPRVPAKMTLAAGLHENLSRTLAEKNFSLFPVPVGNTTLRFC